MLGARVGSAAVCATTTTAVQARHKHVRCFLLFAFVALPLAAALFLGWGFAVARDNAQLVCYYGSPSAEKGFRGGHRGWGAGGYGLRCHRCDWVQPASRVLRNGDVYGWPSEVLGRLFTLW